CLTGKEKSKVVRAQWTWDYIDIMSPKVNNVPLKEGDHNSWLEFKKLDEGRGQKHIQIAWVDDVQDVANAHIQAFENPSASGRVDVLMTSHLLLLSKFQTKRQRAREVTTLPLSKASKKQLRA
ncbi:hypothetical protein Tco_1478571, partial [Tanacetum coccineum]